MLLGVRFPESYRQMIRRFSGSYGDADIRIDRPSGGFDRCSIGLILSLLPHNPDSIYGVMQNWKEHALSPKVVPIGEDGGGNYLCLDFRAGDEPAVAFYFHELYGDDGVMRVCETFDELLNRARLP
ncbi:MAG: SMI1/KNR4 family protein [Planctomycetes bacterium]|nr:SMI1/KNR4 family protein [Planctomycetota bacterium]